MDTKSLHTLVRFSLYPQLRTLDSWMSGEPSKNIAKINFNHVNSSAIPPKKTRNDMFVTRRNGLTGPHVTHVPQLCVNITDSQPVKLANRKEFSV